jgi:hypothetical protein
MAVYWISFANESRKTDILEDKMTSWVAILLETLTNV